MPIPRTPAIALLALVALATGTTARASAQATEELVRSFLWPAGEEEFAEAARALEADGAADDVDRETMRRLTAWIRRGPELPPAEGVGDALQELLVSAPDHRQVPALVRLPSAYTPGRRWPLLLALHGGPPGSVEGARRGALDMVRVWAAAAEEAGWIVVAPAMVDVVSRDGRTADRLPYEIFHAEEARAVVDAVRSRYAVDPDRVVSTGISLGSNFSIAYAAASPDWLSAIVPVSTEGESREWLLRNLAPVPVYVLEGAQDRNIRAVSGPRAMDAIMTRLGYDWVYREFPDRSHEGFQEHYPEVLAWLEARPRRATPTEVIRVPHDGIVPPSRRVHWIETDTRGALVRARVTAPSSIDVTVRWANTVSVLLNDDLVDMDLPVTIRVNGEQAFHGTVARSARVALAEAKRSGDEGRVYAARLTLGISDSPEALAAAARLTEELEPEVSEGTLSYWETYAVRALEERFPSLGFDAVEAPLPAGMRVAPEQVALRVTEVDAEGVAAAAGLRVGDVLLGFGGELFFAGRGGADGLYRWLLREVRSTPTTYQLQAMRGGTPVSLRIAYALGPYRGEGQPPERGTRGGVPRSPGARHRP